MRMLQIDAISVVARSPCLVLWSRLGDDVEGHFVEEIYPVRPRSHREIGFEKCQTRPPSSLYTTKFLTAGT